MFTVNNKLSLNYMPNFAEIFWLNIFFDRVKKHCFTEINVLFTEKVWGRAVCIRTQKMDPRGICQIYFRIPACRELLGQSSLIVQSGFILDYVYTSLSRP